MSKPLVSIIIPTFNAGKYIKATIESILNQSFRDFEIIVVDDGSTDDIVNLLKKYGSQIRYFYQKNSGPAVARNRAIFEAQGQYLAFCDSDDIWESNKLEKQMKVIEKYPDCGLIGTNGIFINENNEYLNRHISEDRVYKGDIQFLGIEDLLKDMCLYPSATLLKKEAILMTGLLFDSFTYFFENVQLYLRIAENHKVIFINEPLIKRRYLNSSLSHKYTTLNRYAQVKVYSFALLDFPEHKEIIMEKLQHSRYSLVRLELKNKEISNARDKLLECIKYNPFFARKYITNKDGTISKLRKIFAPFMFLLFTYLHRELAYFLIGIVLKENDNLNDNW